MCFWYREVWQRGCVCVSFITDGTGQQGLGRRLRGLKPTWCAERQWSDKDRMHSTVHKQSVTLETDIISVIFTKIFSNQRSFIFRKHWSSFSWDQTELWFSEIGKRDTEALADETEALPWTSLKSSAHQDLYFSFIKGSKGGKELIGYTRRSLSDVSKDSWTNPV